MCKTCAKILACLAVWLGRGVSGVTEWWLGLADEDKDDLRPPSARKAWELFTMWSARVAEYADGVTCRFWPSGRRLRIEAGFQPIKFLRL